MNYDDFIRVTVQGIYIF